MFIETYRRRADVLRQQLEPLVQELAAATADMPNREAWQAIAARQPSIPLGLRRRISFRDAVWGARARLRQERERAFQPTYTRATASTRPTGGTPMLKCLVAAVAQKAAVFGRSAPQEPTHAITRRHQQR
jgi:hypothetical protein